jgi:hypothetical protein
MRPTGRFLELKRHGIDADASRRPARIVAVVGMVVQDDANLEAINGLGKPRISRGRDDLVRLALDRRFDRRRVQDDRGRYDATSSVCSVLPSRLSCISVKPAARIIRSSSPAE